MGKRGRKGVGQEREGQRAGVQEKGGEGESQRGDNGINSCKRTSCRRRDEHTGGLESCEAAEEQREDPGDHVARLPAFNEQRGRRSGEEEQGSHGLIEGKVERGN